MAPLWNLLSWRTSMFWAALSTLVFQIPLGRPGPPTSAHSVLTLPCFKVIKPSTKQGPSQWQSFPRVNFCLNDFFVGQGFLEKEGIISGFWFQSDNSLWWRSGGGRWQAAAAAPESSHLEPEIGDREGRLKMAHPLDLESTPNDVLSPARPHFLWSPHSHQLGTKRSDAWEFGRHLIQIVTFHSLSSPPHAHLK